MHTIMEAILDHFGLSQHICSWDHLHAKSINMKTDQIEIGLGSLLNQPIIIIENFSHTIDHNR